MKFIDAKNRLVTACGRGAYKFNKIYLQTNNIYLLKTTDDRNKSSLKNWTISYFLEFEELMFLGCQFSSD